jgi:hypothetical protein
MRILKFANFADDQNGAITVDWVVLTAATVGLGLASAVAVRNGTSDLGGRILDSLSTASVAVLAGANALANGSFSPSGFLDTGGAAYAGGPRHFFNSVNHLEGWDVMSPFGQRVDIGPGNYFTWTAEFLGADGHFVDMVGRPGDRLEMQQSVALDPGQGAIVSFKIGAEATQSGMEVYWGNQLLASYDASNTPHRRFETVSFQVTGGAGDGSNALRFKATDGSGWTGTLLADVQVTPSGL